MKLWLDVRFWFAVVAVAYSTVLALGFADVLSSEVFAVLNRILSGGVVSFLFYFLVVRLPERRRRRIVSETLLHQYEAYRRDLRILLREAEHDPTPEDVREAWRQTSVFTHQLRTALAAIEVRSPDLYRELSRLEGLLTELTVSHPQRVDEKLWHLVRDVAERDGADPLEALLRDL